MKTLTTLILAAIASASALASPDTVVHRRGNWRTAVELRAQPEFKGKTYVLMPTRKDYAGTREFRGYAQLVASRLEAYGLEYRPASELGTTDYVFALDYLVADPYLVDYGITPKDGGFYENRYPQFVNLFVYAGHVSAKGEWALLCKLSAERTGYFSDTEKCVPAGLEAIFADFPGGQVAPDTNTEAARVRTW